MWKHDRFLEQAGLLILLSLIAGPSFSTSSSFGINYGKIANNLPAPAEVVTLIQSISLTKSKLYDADPLVLRTFGNTGISFLVGIGNEELAALADSSVAMTWVQQNVQTYLPSTDIIGLVVGNEVFSNDDTNQMSQVLPAMKNVYSALTKLNLQNQVVVSTAHSFSVLASSYPPSSGAFNPSIATQFMQPILEFLSQTGAPFMINAYPFFAYKSSPNTVSLAYVLFQDNPGVMDSTTGLLYTNMFDAQMDALYSAMAALGYKNVSILVSETGWPSAGDADEPGATVENAQIYHENLIRHVSSNQGTPLRPNTTMDVYLFALFNEDLKPGPTSERNYGLFKPDGSMVYTLNFSSSTSHFPVSTALQVSIGCCWLLLVLLLRF